MRGTALLVGGSILSCASLAIAQAPTEEVVATAFAWPVGTEASVTTYQRIPGAVGHSPGGERRAE